MSWDIFSKIADVVGVLSFLFAMPTYFIAKSTQKAIRDHDDKKQYKDEIKSHIDTLKADYESIFNNDIYNERILNNVLQELDRIRINYPSVLKPFKSEFGKLEKIIKQTILKLPSDPNFNRTNTARQLNKIIERLEKEEKSI